MDELIFYSCKDCHKMTAIFAKELQGLKKGCCFYCGDYFIERVVPSNRPKKKKIKPWADEEERLLVSLLPVYLNKEIAEKLGRTERSVTRKLEDLRKKGIETVFRKGRNRELQNSPVHTQITSESNLTDHKGAQHE